MKYTVELEIEKPIDELVRLYDNPDNLYSWMEGLKSIDPIAGDPGQPGAQSRMVFESGKRTIEMTETIKERNLPEVFGATYETNGVLNIQNNHFVSLGPDKTKYISENEFRFTGLMKFLSPLMKEAFKKQTLKYLKQFKAFAERQ